MNNLGDLLKLIKYPSLTEKSINLYGDRQYTFIVDRTLTKTQIKFVIETYQFYNRAICMDENIVSLYFMIINYFFSSN